MLFTTYKKRYFQYLFSPFTQGNPVISWKNNSDKIVHFVSKYFYTLKPY